MLILSSVDFRYRCETPAQSSGTVETPEALKTLRRLNARPAESEQPGTKINSHV
jgi:hypothetical protein